MNKKYLTTIALSPIVINFIYNQIYDFNFSWKLVSNILLKFSVSSILFLIIFLIEKSINQAFKLNSTTVSIVVYIMTFYVINYYFMYFLKNFSTKNIFVFYNILLFLILIFKSKSNFKLISSSLFLFIFINIFLEQFNLYETLIFNEPITSDEIKMWIPRSVIISDQNIYEIYNQEVGGGTMSFGLLAHFTFVFLEYIFHFSMGYIPSQIISNVIFFLFTYFIFENYKFNFYTRFGYVAIILVFLTSNWFSYFLINSHLGETFSTFYFGVLFFYLIKNNLKFTQYMIALFYLSNLIYSKRFILVLVCLSIIHLIYQNREKVLFKLAVIFSSFIPIFINYLLLDVPLLWVVQNEPTNAIMYSGSTYNPNAIVEIVKQFLIDRPVSYFVFITILLIICNLRKLNNFEIITISLLVLNTSFVFSYFVFISTFNSSWGDAYRYLINPIYILFFIFLELLNKNTQEIKI